jgi:hypothetical protein
MESVRRLRVVDGRPCFRGRDDGELLGARWNVDRGDRILWFQRPVLCYATDVLSGTGLAAGIAWINSIGNLGGFFGPWYVGTLKDLTGGYAGGLYGLALFGLVASFVCAFLLHIPNRAPPV